MAVRNDQVGPVAEGKEAGVSFVLGIDPGQKGGVVCLDAASGALLDAFPLPGGADGPDLVALRRRLTVLANRSRPGLPAARLKEAVALAALEYIRPFMKMKLKSLRTLLCGFYEVRGFLKVFELASVSPEPQVWKKVILAGTAQDKAAAIAYCQRRFPGVCVVDGEEHDGVADAACLACYALLQLGKGDGS